jgi:uncharacterized cupredoxin-like copper-binding protein
VRSALQRRAALALAILATLAVSACAEKEPASTEGGRKVVHVSERDFSISAPKRLAPGDVVLSVKNRGPDDHELIVAKVGKSHLPFRRDGLTLDEDAAERSIVGALEPGEPGTRRLRVRLTPGRYLLICNMSGHYLGGMDRELEVR